MNQPIFTAYPGLSSCSVSSFASVAVWLAVGLLSITGSRLAWAQTQTGEPTASTRSDAAQPTALPASLRIVKLLWAAQPKGAAGALDKAVDQALTRGEAQSLKPGLLQLAESFHAGLAKGPKDPRYSASLAALTLAGDAKATESASEQLMKLDQAEELTASARQLLLRCWLSAAPEPAGRAMLQLLQTADTSALEADQKPVAEEWLQIVALTALETQRESAAEVLLHRWSAWPRSMQVSLIEPLSQQPALMKQLIAAIERGVVPKEMLNTNQLHKWNEGQDAELIAAIERVWGKLRMTQDDDRKRVVEQTLKLLSSGKAGNPAAGESTFKRICIQCHRLHGQGFDVGPEITSNGRGSFEQLVSNVMDPSLVIGKAFLAKTVLTQDGRVIAGIVAAEDDKRLTLKVQGGQLVELDREDDIDEIKESAKSLMPDGLEKQMSEQELLDLFAYLSLVRPLSSPENELIPGTPGQLVP